MNEYERRALDIAKSSSYLATYARENKNILDVQYYAYNVSDTVINASNVGQAIIQIQADSDFVLSYMSAAVTSAGVVLQLPNVTVQITDTGSGKTLMSNPTQISNVFGNFGFPFLLPAPRVFMPNTNIKFDYANRIAAQVEVSVSLFGARIYYAN